MRPLLGGWHTSYCTWPYDDGLERGVFWGNSRFHQKLDSPYSSSQGGGRDHVHTSISRGLPRYAQDEMRVVFSSRANFCVLGLDIDCSWLRLGTTSHYGNFKSYF